MIISKLNERPMLAEAHLIDSSVCFGEEAIALSAECGIQKYYK